MEPRLFSRPFVREVEISVFEHVVYLTEIGFSVNQAFEFELFIYANVHTNVFTPLVKGEQNVVVFLNDQVFTEERLLHEVDF
jgi:hypothetical protein